MIQELQYKWKNFVTKVKRKLTMIRELLPTLVSFILGGGLVTLFTLHATRKKSNAEATGAEIGNVSKVNDEWQELFDKNKDQYESILEKTNNLYNEEHVKVIELEKKLDERWTDTLQHREREEQLYKTILEQKENISELKTQIVQLEYRKCNRIGCKDREPPSELF